MIPQAELDDLQERLTRARWPHPVPSRGDRADFSRGIPTSYVRELAEHWRDGFDWAAHEAALNQLPQFTTMIDGQTFHLVHARSTNPDATPLLLCHGWPGSFVEYLRLIPLLTDDFHVVIAAPPGFGFSTPLAAPGWDIVRTAGAFAEIMTRLGYERFGLHGSDIGSGIVGHLAATVPERVIGMHIAAEQRILSLVGSVFPAPEGLSAADGAALDTIRDAAAAGRGYLELQNHRPDTLGPALTDSPIALLAWLVDTFEVRDHAGVPDDLIDRDHLLTAVSLYWFTRSGESSAQFYFENEHSGREILMGFSVPAGWAVFDSHPLVRRAIDPATMLGHWSDFAEGGHFPAMDVPHLLAEDIHTFFDGLV